MSMSELQKQTNANIQAKANLIWEIATHLVGLFKPHEYGKVILPMTVLKRFDDALKPTKAAVVEMAKKLDVQHVEGAARDGILCRVSGYDFYNTSNFDFAKLIADPDSVESNFEAYLQGFSANIKDIIDNFDFSNTVKLMVKGGVLFVTLQEFNSSKADMSPDKITSADMGYIFEELIRKFSESYDEQAGAHFTSRDIIYLMTELLVAPEKTKIMAEGCTKTAYDMAMGTSQMLGCLTERLQSISKEATLTCFGQEFNPETYAIAKADMLIKSGNASGMKFGDTLLMKDYDPKTPGDQFEGYQFDYIISNPPFGIDWKREKASVEAEAKNGFDGRFGPGLPSIGDGQLLFMLNGIKKLKETGSMAIIQNGSPLYYGEPESGTSNIRKYILDNDYVSAIVRLPSDLFYNTALITYIWIINKNKPQQRKGRIQLIDAYNCFEKRRRPIGKKRKDLSADAIRLIVDAFESFETTCHSQNGLSVKSMICNIADFAYKKVTIFAPQYETNGRIKKLKGKPLFDKATKTEEKFPIDVDPIEYIAANPNLYEPNAMVDASKTKIGYDIPFTRIFFESQHQFNSQTILRGLESSVLLDDAMKGLNQELVALSQYTDLVDSGVDWIGMIPTTWKVNPISYYFTERNERCNEQDYQPLSVTKKGVVPQLETVAKSEAGGDSRKKVLKGDFVINSRSDRRQSCGVSPMNGSVSLINIVLKPKKNIIPEFAGFVLKNYGFADEFFKWGHGIAWDVWTTNYIDMKKIMIPVPPIEEQRRICAALAKLNKIIVDRENELQQLKDYCSVITYETITAKSNKEA